MIRNNKVNKEVIVNKLIYTYPDAIENDNGILNFDETISNFAECIWRDFDTERQNYHFNTQFASQEDCERWLKDNLDCIYDICQEFINTNNLEND
jgi:hypothetical protein